MLNDVKPNMMKMEQTEKERLIDLAKWIQINGNYMTPEKQVKYFLDENVESINCLESKPKALNAMKDVVNQREQLLDFANYSESDKTSQTTDECVDNYLDSIK